MSYSLRPPPSRLERNPLITPGGWQMWRRIHEHPDAPRWNYEVGDRVVAADLPKVERYREKVAVDRPVDCAGPPPWLLEWVARQRLRVPLFRRRLPEGLDLGRHWAQIETMNREDIALRIETLVPDDADLSRLIVYDTSGTRTGHTLDVPQSPAAVALNHPLLEFVLARFGVHPRFDSKQVACLNVGAEATTVVFPNVFSVWGDAGFAKINLHPDGWDDVEQAQRFVAAMRPEFLTGDPVGFAEMVRWGIDYRPAALVSTATSLSPRLKAQLERHFAAPVIDFYSTTETGPIAYANPEGRGFSVLPPDLYVEVLDSEGFPVPPGELGEIAVSGGRNPYLPLLRYRTGDYARYQPQGVAGDPAPCLTDLHAREPVLYRAFNGAAIHPLDITRVLRRHVWVQHELLQRGDGSLRLLLRSGVGQPLDLAQIRTQLIDLFGKVDLEVREDPELGGGRPGGKVVAYASELEWESLQSKI